MADIRYTPQFHHEPWIDRLHRVIADGPNGFNFRFNTIEADFQTLSQVVAQIATALDRLEQRLPSGPITLTLTPNLVLVQTANPWLHHIHGYAFKSGDRVRGIMSVGLTGPVRIESFRAIGSVRGDDRVRISLWRSHFETSRSPELISEIRPGDFSPFDVTVPGDPAFATIDPAQYKCFIDAEAVRNPQGSVDEGAIVSAFQITYQPL